MAEFWYNIEQFEYNRENKVLCAEESHLLHYGCVVTFPNQGRQFFVINKNTNNFRRFRLKHDEKEKWIFESEDNIICIVKKELERKVLIEKFKQ